MTYMSNVYQDFYDERDCESCGGEQTVNIEGNYSEAHGTCTECGETMWVYRAEELYYDAAEAAGDYERDER